MSDIRSEFEKALEHERGCWSGPYHANDRKAALWAATWALRKAIEVADKESVAVDDKLRELLLDLESNG